MNAVQKRQFLPETVFRNGFIGRQHKIFDQIGCFIALIGFNGNGMSFCIQMNLTLRKIKVQRASFTPFCTQKLRQSAHAQKHGNKFFIFFLCFPVICQNRCNLCIGHAAVHPDYRFRNTV